MQFNFLFKVSRSKKNIAEKSQKKQKKKSPKKSLDTSFKQDKSELNYKSRLSEESGLDFRRSFGSSSLGRSSFGRSSFGRSSMAFGNFIENCLNIDKKTEDGEKYMNYFRNERYAIRKLAKVDKQLSQMSKVFEPYQMKP